MNNFRLYGNKPYRVAVIHGGPGAPGEMAPVARELSSAYGVVEPLQTAMTVTGQVEELRKVLEENAALPAVLIGHSWGAWLSFILAAEHPSFVSKLILVSSAPFEDKYAAAITNTRMSRLTEKERTEVLAITMALNSPESPDKNRALSRFGELISKADAFDPLLPGNEVIWCRYDIYESVWPEAAEMRRSGRLLEFGKRIKCPVVAIHGDYDPHPAEGVKEPLSGVLPDFRFVLLERCGHTPWNERSARDDFYGVLKKEIATMRE
jgi:pimeloyl-ACP methyl ester carboxylesterase